MYLTKALARRLECCFKQTHIEMASSGEVLDLTGGAACFAGPNSFFSQVVAWGFATKPKAFQTQIQRIECFYQSLAHDRVDIELCPLVGDSLLVFLSQRGYQIAELSHVSFIDLKTYSKPISEVKPFLIREVSSHELKHWANGIAQGFGCLDAQEQFYRYAQLKGAKVFGVYDKEQIVAGGTVVIHDDVADLGVTSTLPPYRGKGLQKKLLEVRLEALKQQGISLAMVTTQPGSISDLNVQKAGFQQAYTRIKMTKRLLSTRQGIPRCARDDGL